MKMLAFALFRLVDVYLMKFRDVPPHWRNFITAAGWNDVHAPANTYYRHLILILSRFDLRESVRRRNSVNRDTHFNVER